MGMTADLDPKITDFSQTLRYPGVLTCRIVQSRAPQFVYLFAKLFCKSALNKTKHVP